MSTSEALPDFEKMMREAVASQRAAEEAARAKAREEARLREAARDAFVGRMSGSLRDVGEMLGRLAADQVFVDANLALRGPEYLTAEDGQREQYVEQYVWKLGTILVFSVLEDAHGAHCLSVAGRGSEVSVQLRPGSGPHSSRAAVPPDYDAFLRWMASRGDMFSVITPLCPSLVVKRAEAPGNGGVELLLDGDASGVPPAGWLVSAGTAFRYATTNPGTPFMVEVRDAGEGLPPLWAGAAVQVARTDSPVGREIARMHERSVRARIAAAAADVRLADAMTKRFAQIAAAVGDFAAALLSSRSGRLLCGAVPDGIKRVPERFLVGPTLRKGSENVTLGRLEVEISCVARKSPEDGAMLGTDPGELPVVVQVMFKAHGVRMHVCTWHWKDGLLDGKAMVAGMLSKAAAFMAADQAQDAGVRYGDWDLQALQEEVPAPLPAPSGLR